MSKIVNWLLVSSVVLMMSGCGGGGSGGETVTNKAPTAQAGSDFLIHENESATLDASGSADVDGSIVSYSWMNGTVSLGDGITLEDITLAVGKHSITLTVTDNDGKTATDIVVVEVNKLPTANAGNDIVADEGQQVTLSASESSDDKSLMAYNWSEGNTLLGSSENIELTLTVGAHNITLLVTDTSGKIATDTVKVTIKNTTPIAKAGNDREVNRATEVTLDASESSDIGGIKSYEWKEGAQVLGTAKRIQTSFTSIGEHRVVLKVTDNHGKSATDEVIITVLNQAPTAKAGNDFLIHENETASFDASESTDADGNIVSYVWSEGTTILSEDEVAADIDLTAGEHNITLTVTDNDGAEAADVILVKVNKLPIVTIEGNLSNVWGEDVQLDGSASTDDDGSIVSYLWSNGVETKMSTFENLPLGNNDVTLSVTDNDGGAGEGAVAVKTVMCLNEEDMELSKDVNGTVNMEPNTNHVSCYKIHLSSNNGSELFTLYANLYEGTTASHSGYQSYKHFKMALHDSAGTLVKDFGAGMSLNGSRKYKQFSITQDGDYYLKVQRARGYAAKYGISIHPSLSNGLMQDSKGELNDFKNMATPLTLAETQTDINGTLNMTRVVDSSMQGSDQYDFYEIDFDKTGTFTLYANLYEGTTSVASYFLDRHFKMALHDSAGVLVKDFGNGMSRNGSRMYKQFDIPSEGKYYLRLYRKSGYAANYGFSIQLSNANGLIQDSKGELNDFKNMATPLTLAETQTDINGTLNMTRVVDSSMQGSDQYDFYEIDFDKTGTFTLYANLYEGTTSVASYFLDRHFKMALHDSAGTLVKDFGTGMRGNGSRMYKQFNIPSEGKYYLRLYRKSGYAANYGFSIQLSNANGLIQDSKGELNDFKNMATPLTLAETQTDINGTLNMTRVVDSSMQGSDQYDFYEIDFDKTGTFTLYANLYEGTTSVASYFPDRHFKMALHDSAGTLVKDFGTGMRGNGSSMEKQFNIPLEGKYYLRLYRASGYAANYRFHIIE